MKNNRTAWITSFTALTVLMGLDPLAHATYPGHNGLITFSADTGSGSQIYTVRPNGHDLRQLTHVDGDAVNPDWSPDGRKIVFELDTANSVSIELMNVDGSDLTNLTPIPACCPGQPSFTPDGQQIVFERFDLDTLDDAIWIMNVDGSDLHRIIGPWPNGFATDPNVSPDGNTLSFAGWDGSLVGPAPSFEPARALFASGIDGGNPVQLTPFSSDLAIKHDWAPNGRHLLVTVNANFFHPRESANIATIRPDGTGFHYLTHFTGGDVSAFVGSYSPDGHWIVFRLEDHGLYGLYRIRSEGGAIHTILSLSNFRPRYIDWGAGSGQGEDDE
jgi:Tol biopolymer transport system component